MTQREKQEEKNSYTGNRKQQDGCLEPIPTAKMLKYSKTSF